MDDFHAEGLDLLRVRAVAVELDEKCSGHSLRVELLLAVEPDPSDNIGCRGDDRAIGGGDDFKLGRLRLGVVVNGRKEPSEAHDRRVVRALGPEQLGRAPRGHRADIDDLPAGKTQSIRPHDLKVVRLRSDDPSGRGGVERPALRGRVVGREVVPDTDRNKVGGRQVGAEAGRRFDDAADGDVGKNGNHRLSQT